MRTLSPCCTVRVQLVCCLSTPNGNIQGRCCRCSEAATAHATMGDQVVKAVSGGAEQKKNGRGRQWSVGETLALATSANEASLRGLTHEAGLEARTQANFADQVNLQVQVGR